MKFDEVDQDEITENRTFRELVGSLMLLATSTRPDISTAARALARYFSAPKAFHWKMALGILAYVQGTSRYIATFQKCTVSGLA